MAKILLVDDDEDLAETLADLFQMLDHEVLVVGAGGPALQAMITSEFDLILLDWQLPDMAGIDVCKQYREKGGKARVLMLTGMRDAGSKEAGKAAGADDFLTKPFSVDQLTDRLQAMLA
jgi:two-component system, OmpR family, manganese sensing response regulator